VRSSARARILAIAIAGAAVGGGAAAEGASAGGPGDLAAGSALNHFPTPLGPGFARLNVAAHSDGSGLNPSGHVEADGTTGVSMGQFHVGGPVTCLRVDGKKAAIKYRFDQATGSAAPFKGGGVEVFIEDNGQPRNGHSVDANANNPPQPAGVFQTTESQCDDPNAASYSTVISGNYTVRDR
jgi:hypothetical protein